MIRIVLSLVAGILSIGTPAPAQSVRTALLTQPPVKYDSDATAYFTKIAANGCLAPSRQWKSAVNTFIVSEKATGGWASLEWLYLLAAPDQCTALINMRQPSLYQLTVVGIGTFSATLGYSGDGSTGYLEMPVNLSALEKMLQNNAHVGAWQLAANRSNTVGLLASTTGLSLSPATNKGTRLMSSTVISDTAGGLAGFHWADRSSSATISTGLNATTQSASIANTSTAPAAAHIVICRAGSSLCSANARIVEAEGGAAMSDEAGHYTRLRALLVGTGVTVP